MTKRESDKPSIPAGVLDVGAGRPEDDALIDSLFGDGEAAGSALAGEIAGEDDVTVPRGAIEVRMREAEPEATVEEEYLEDLSDVELLDGELGESSAASAVDFYDAVRPLSHAPLTESERVAAEAAGRMPMDTVVSPPSELPEAISGGFTEGDVLNAPVQTDVAPPSYGPPASDSGQTVLTPPPFSSPEEPPNVAMAFGASAEDSATGEVNAEFGFVDDDSFHGEDTDEVAIAAFAMDPDTASGLDTVTPSTEDDGEVILQAEPGTDAVVSLIQRGDRDAWADRAEWLYEEARAIDDPKTAARSLAVVAELFAMAGDPERAVEVVRQALELSPDDPVAHRLRRGLSVSDASWSGAAKLLDEEARVAASRHAKVHAHGLAGHLRRLNAPNDPAYQSSLDQAQRASPTDVRPILQRLAVSLALTDEPPAPIDGVPAPLKDAVEVLRAMRSEGRDGTDVSDPYVTVLAARDALRRRDVAAALTALAALDIDETFGGGSRWLRAALAAPHPELREAGLSALEGVTEGSHGSLAKRSLVARALEAGDERAVVAFANDGGAEVLSSADRLVLAALSGKSFGTLAFERLDSWIADTARDDDYETLAAAVSGVLCGEHAPAATLSVGTPRHRAEVRLGRTLASVALGNIELDGATETSQELLGVDASHGAARAVVLERAFRAQRRGEVADVLPDRENDGRLIRLLLHELDVVGGSDEPEATDSPAEFAMRDQLGLAFEQAPQSELLLRMALRHCPEKTTAVGAAAALAAQAEAIEEPHASAAAWREAALRYDAAGSSSDTVRAFSQSVAVDPRWSLAHGMVHHIARSHADDATQHEWLGRRATYEHVEPAIERLRQALHPSDVAQEDRDALLDEALAMRPNDASLRELHATLTGRRAVCPPEDVTVVEFAVEGALGSELDRDWDAMKAYTERVEALGDELFAPMFRRRLARRGVDALAHAEQLQAAARATSDPALRGELNLAAACDLIAGDQGERAHELLKKAVEQGGGSLALSHLLTSRFLPKSTDAELAAANTAIASVVGGAEAVAHLKLAARLRGRDDLKYEFVASAQEILQHLPNDPWSLRVLQADAMKRRDADAMMAVVGPIAADQEGSLDAASLWLRAAELHLMDGRDEMGEFLLDRCLEIWPRHLLARMLRAKLLERRGPVEKAAEAYERLALVCRTPSKRAEAFYRAASLWLSRDDAEAKHNGRRLLESVTEIDAGYKDSFELLRAIYMASGAKSDLADLLGARLDHVEDPDRRTELEVMRGKILAETGSGAEAKAALAAALAASPDNIEALRAYVEVCTADRDWSSTEQALLRLGRLLVEAEEQSAIYLQLGQLYDGPLGNTERAEKAYQEVIRVAPAEMRPREKLVSLYLRDGDSDKALAQQRAMIDVTEDPVDQCVRTVRLAEIFEQLEDAEQAETVLVGARRRFTKDAEPVRALVDFYRRQEKYAAADMLLGRAAAEVRRGLGAGRFEPNLFAMTATVAELRGDHDVAEVARASLAAIHGDQVRLSGMNAAAVDPDNDERLAPSVFSRSFRQLLCDSRGVMDAAVPLDLPGLGATLLGASYAEFNDRVRHIAAASGIGEVTVLVSTALERGCVAVAGVEVAGTSPTIVFGEALLRSDRVEVRDFLLRRAMKTLQARTAALARTEPSDIGPLLAAFLKLHKPDFVPTGVDRAKLDLFGQRMADAGGTSQDPRLLHLVDEVIGSIGNRASGLRMAAQVWASRAALLATGDPFVAIEALAWASGADAELPAHGPERVKWIGRHAEVRDLVAFTVSEDYRNLRGGGGS